MLDLPESLKNPDRRTLWQFAAGWTVFFLGLGGYYYGWLGHKRSGLECGGIAAIGLGLYWFAPVFFRRIFAAAMLLALPLGWLTSQLSLGIIFYGVVTPFALALNLVGRDRLMKGRRPAISSYWKPKTTAVKVRRYFRTY